MDEHPMSTVEYLASDETTRPRELSYGILREPPAPFFSHQAVVLRIARMLSAHVEAGDLGQVGVSPVDVILDGERDLIVQPDVLFVSAGRASIIHDQVWGPPDLVVEVLSPGTAAHDRGAKLDWYRQYGVCECWLVDPAREQITVIDFTRVPPRRQVLDRTAIIRSSVLPALQAAVGPLVAC